MLWEDRKVWDFILTKVLQDKTVKHIQPDFGQRRTENQQGAYLPKRWMSVVYEVLRMWIRAMQTMTYSTWRDVIGVSSTQKKIIGLPIAIVDRDVFPVFVGIANVRVV